MRNLSDSLSLKLKFETSVFIFSFFIEVLTFTSISLLLSLFNMLDSFLFTLSFSSFDIFLKKILKFEIKSSFSFNGDVIVSSKTESLSLSCSQEYLFFASIE